MNGWKTQVGAGIGFLLMFLEQKFPGVSEAFGPYTDDIAGGAAALLVAVGLIHKGWKAYKVEK